MRLAFHSLSFRLVGLTAIMVILGFAVLVSYSTYSQVKNSQEDAQRYLSSLAEQYALDVRIDIEEALVAARGMAHAIEGPLRSGSTDRSAFARIVENTIRRYPGIVGGAVGLDSNIAGQDSDVAGQGYNDDAGRLLPYFYQDGKGGVAWEPLALGGDSGSELWYDLPKTTKQEVVTEPYVYPVNGEDVVMTTATVPIFDAQDRAVGVATTDMALKDIQIRLSELKLFETGTVSLITAEGMWVSHPDDTKLAQLEKSPALTPVLAALKAGKDFFGVVDDPAVGGERFVSVQSMRFGMAETTWGIVVSVPESEIMAQANQARNLMIIISLLVVIAVIAINALIGTQAMAMLGKVTNTMRNLADGQTDLEIPGRNRRDEIGAMAQTVAVFRENALEKQKLEAEQKHQQETAVIERKSTLDKIATRFHEGVSGLIQDIEGSVRDMKTFADTMTGMAQETRSRASEASQSSENANDNAQAVASASEQLAASVGEIGQQVGQATTITNKAVGEAGRSNENVQSLAQAAQRIGEVVKLISDIAEQTNLLALNATIEAARAGEAGKGFAVVASEVKSLATQTSNATGEIEQQVFAIQTQTNNAVESIGEISRVIGQIDEISTVIAGAVEEQGAATQDISEKIQMVATGVSSIRESIAGVDQVSEQTDSAARSVVDTITNLDQKVRALNEEANRLVAEVRGA
ncbi:methyl-accepting chemotaxis protein [Kiloniella laminariae]|uniref:Methyl-accepting chemotaxis protein n=1 Tax=Kiloniella laminariae TaxID=454162 RepID=A0ABT4LM93_9PROT|nr:methyl-accepting chemotaxis protein [Kiloniella laminariae]MCZ4282250.1 methyl-accepting chemotaxis protein [Kiloniella laminariae]